jgi:hypothetical protein
MGQVIHVSDELHTLLKSYCKEKGFKIKDWADSILREAVSRGVTPVPKKKMETLSKGETNEGPNVYERPPFWAKPRPPKEERKQEEKEVERPHRLEVISGGLQSTAGEAAGVHRSPLGGERRDPSILSEEQPTGDRVEDEGIGSSPPSEASKPGVVLVGDGELPNSLSGRQEEDRQPDEEVRSRST